MHLLPLFAQLPSLPTISDLLFLVSTHVSVIIFDFRLPAFSVSGHASGKVSRLLTLPVVRSSPASRVARQDEMKIVESKGRDV